MKFNRSKWWHKFSKAFCTILRFSNHDNMVCHLLCFTELKCFILPSTENFQQQKQQCKFKSLEYSAWVLSTVVDHLSAIWERLPEHCEITKTSFFLKIMLTRANRLSAIPRWTQHWHSNAESHLCHMARFCWFPRFLRISLKANYG